MKRLVFLCLAVGWLIGGRPLRVVAADTRATAVAAVLSEGEATALKLDGELTEEFWSRAPVIDGFVQREPKEGAAPTYKTEARVAYDSSHIYVAVTAFDPEPDKIVGYLTRRDSGSPSDWIRVA